MVENIRKLSEIKSKDVILQEGSGVYYTIAVPCRLSVGCGANTSNDLISIQKYQDNL